MWSWITTELNHLSSNYAIDILFLSCVICLFYWRRLPLEFKWLTAYLFFCLCIEVGAHLMSHQGNNLPLLHLYTLGEFLLWSFFFKTVLGKDSWLNKYFVPFLMGITGLVVANSVFLQPIWGFNSHAKTLVQLVIIVYALVFAFHYAEFNVRQSNAYKILRFINALILMYYCATLFIFMSSGFWTANDLATNVLVRINKWLNILFLVLILFSIWKVTRFLHNSSSSQVSVS